MRIHGLAPGLNYGQQAFEGLKAFRMPGEPGGITLFRPERNAMRLQHSSTVLNMPSVPTDLFMRACHAAVAFNAEYVPPHETGCAMYCRPLLFASGPMFFPGKPDECTFCVYVFPTPLSASQERVRAVKALILDDFDRAAPKGTGHAKAGGNYAGVLRWTGGAKMEGFGITLHLDSARHEEVDEFSTCGFLGVKRRSPGARDDDDDDVTLVVPDSPCAIDSVTSDSVQHIARSWGWSVEKRRMPYTELPEFSEIIGAGTAVGLVPIQSITRRGTGGTLTPHARLVVANGANSETIVYMPDDQQAGGLVFQKLWAQFRAVQLGKVPDEFGWRSEVQAKDKDLDVKNERS